jgi:hypothetical protein
MTSPPRVAAWLLRTLGSDPDIETLIGDLSEEYCGGRSRAWFWWQALMAIPITFLDTIRAHPFLIARALACGWLALLSARYLAWKAISFVEVVGYARVPDGTIPIDTWHYLYGPALSFTAIFATAAIASWLVGRLHTGVRTTAVLTFTAMLALLWTSRHLSAAVPIFGEDMRILDGWWFSITWLTWSPLLLQVSGSLVGGLLRRRSFVQLCALGDLRAPAISARLLLPLCALCDLRVIRSPDATYAR